MEGGDAEVLFPRPDRRQAALVSLCWMRALGSRPGTQERRPPIRLQLWSLGSGAQPILPLAVLGTVRSVLFRRLLAALAG